MKHLYAIRMIDIAIEIEKREANTPSLSDFSRDRHLRRVETLTASRAVLTAHTAASAPASASLPSEAAAAKEGESAEARP